jgi:hypothetical protein
MLGNQEAIFGSLLPEVSAATGTMLESVGWKCA